jgi:hypothetical protein
MSFANDCLDAQGVCPNKIPFLITGQKVTEALYIIIKDIVTGNPVDLTQFGIGSSSSSSSSSPSSSSSSSSSFFSSSSSSGGEEPRHGVEFVAKDLPTNPTHLFRKFGVVESVEDARVGRVRLDVGTHETAKAGIWAAMAGVWQHGLVRKLMPFYYEVQPNLLEDYWNGPLTTYQLRLFLRDRCAEDNFLLDDIEFKQEELHAMMTKVIWEWNEEPPPGFEYTPVDFPFRHNWAEAVIAELFTTAAYQLRRNKLDYTAGGVAINDEARWEFYLARAKELKAEWKSFIVRKKMQLNIEGGYSSLGGYRHTIPR